MTQGTLSEQMGAMACVDTLRRERRQVQEHMNLPQRRADVAASIREYYRSQGIPCDNATIEDGVRMFFAHRLVFEAPVQPWYKRLFAALLIRRQGLLWTLVWMTLLGGVMLAVSLPQPGTSAQPGPAAVASADKGLGMPAPQWSPEADRAAHQARLEQYSQLMVRLEAMPLPDEVRAHLLPFARATGAVVASHGPTKAIQALRELQVYSDFVEAQLQLVIPDAPGQVSGYERCMQDTPCQPGSDNAKAWFLVFQGHDAQGQAVTMPLPNGRTGALDLGDAFAVQVSHAEYLKAQQSKQTNGHVDNPVIGEKDAYSMSRNFDTRLLSGGRYDNPAENSQQITARF